MKLIYIVNARIPTEKAHGVQIMKMCEAFVQNGVDITLAVPRRFGVAKLDPFSYYSIKDKFKIVYLPVLDTYRYGYFGFIIGSLSFSFSSFVYGLLNKRDSIFFSRDQDQFSFLSFFYGLKPYFFEVHGLKNKSFLHNALFKKISGVVSTNSFIKEKLINNFDLLDSKVLCEPNGVEIDMFRPIDKNEARKKLSLPLDKKIVVYAGHFYLWKGVDTLVKASEMVPSDIKIYLVGGNKEDTDRLKNNIPNGSRLVHFMGHRPYTEIPLWYSAADVLVITGTAKDADSVHYTSPIKLFEYMASSREIVAVDSPAIRDIVSQDEVFFYKPDDAKDLSSTIQKACAYEQSGTLDHKIGLRNKIEKYSWFNRAKRIIFFITKNYE